VIASDLLIAMWKS